MTALLVWHCLSLATIQQRRRASPVLFAYAYIRARLPLSTGNHNIILNHYHHRPEKAACLHNAQCHRTREVYPPETAPTVKVVVPDHPLPWLPCEFKKPRSCWNLEWHNLKYLDGKMPSSKYLLRTVLGGPGGRGDRHLARTQRERAANRQERVKVLPRCLRLWGNWKLLFGCGKISRRDCLADDGRRRETRRGGGRHCRGLKDTLYNPSAILLFIKSQWFVQVGSRAPADNTPIIVKLE